MIADVQVERERAQPPFVPVVKKSLVKIMFPLEPARSLDKFYGRCTTWHVSLARAPRKESYFHARISRRGCGPPVAQIGRFLRRVR